MSNRTQQAETEMKAGPTAVTQTSLLGETWRCRTCQTVNMSGWQVCRACSYSPPSRGEWLRSGPLRPLLLVAAAVGVCFVGLVTIIAWAAMVGGGTWLLPAGVFWLLAVGFGLIVAWKRTP